VILTQESRNSKINTHLSRSNYESVNIKPPKRVRKRTKRRKQIPAGEQGRKFKLCGIAFEE
jgi:hypothetical protein